ncbi:cytochrome c oxidase subunit II [Fredinandcohnia quinoae]|uniref:Cytochrome aa3 subunit 2 n=1 Tax=Fredinandcohnia quinoae TaxID=2918902 RepID=A0AAW5ED31_9BACI|nr:cytochrome c oxidase subunit II [Fredinandcohnia sp. SECRCQ15]MCH1627341.1 cytochrome c oxidase subunit II [Fredinandcohnia sp. SECRCQ15]
MHFHKFEKIWLTFGIGTLIVFLAVVGVGAFAMGHQPASNIQTIDPEKVDQTAPFDNPGLKHIEGNKYELNIVTQAFAFTPSEIKIPKGAEVKINVTTKDVVHGFSVAGTNVNMMLEPGYISTYTQKFNKTGEFLIVCNEYCGAGHHLMSAKIEVTE